MMYASAPVTQPAADTKDEVMQKAVVFTAVLLSILGGTLSVVGLERLIRGRFTLFSMVRFLLRSTFLLFLPLLSYMLSHAEGEGEGEGEAKKGELLFVLLWLILIELIRKKVDAMVAEGSFSRVASRFKLASHSDEVTRLVWIGYLIYSKVDSKSKKAMFVILWSLAAAKLGQRVLNEWKAQDSLSAAGSANIIAGYMQHVLEEDEKKHQNGGNSGGSSTATDNPMDRCDYVVMGEEKLMLKEKKKKKKEKSEVFITTPHCGYGVGRFPHDQDELKHVHLCIDDHDKKAKSSLVTVKDISKKLGRFPCSNTRPSFIDHMCRLCFSFSLFKLLRRRFEHYPMVEVGSKMSRRVMVECLLTAGNASRAFRVLQMELDFLENYYQAGVPVVMSAPWLFIINFLSSLLFVFVYFLAAILITLYAAKEEGIVTYSIVTLLLMVTLLAIEITDFLTAYLFSNWFLVHLLCLYVRPGGCMWNLVGKPIICCFIAYRLLVFYSLRLFLRLTGRPVDEKKMKMRQVSVVQACEPIRKFAAWTSQVTVATDAKVAIVKSLLDSGEVISLPLDIIGWKWNDIPVNTITEIILACHLATELLEAKAGDKPTKTKKKKKKQEEEPDDDDDRDHRTVATTLSRYCMYLVARVPELVPDDERWVSDKYEDVKSCLKQEASRGRHRSWSSTWCCPWWRGSSWKQALMEMKEDRLKDMEPAVRAGVELFQQVTNKQDSAAAAWKKLADFWTHLLVYLAPSNDVEGHAKVLASQGSDLITCLWAFCTHAGIKRRSPGPAEMNADKLRVRAGNNPRP
ncbi:hypothetical protein U9M48_011383 [Paspalum notatum var. saurae]|uniref:DUF4220 domain-containing protein n=1 Tax=Paspalum notatum var. saurae TaxID=547442 RepID=A0AAQ3SVM1_PASNO